MTKRVIMSGKVLKDDKVEVEWLEYDASNPKPAECDKKHSAPPHPDLINAINELTVHAIIIGEFADANTLDSLQDIQPDILDKFHVSGFSVTEKKNTETIILTAQKTLNTGKKMGFNTPVTAFDDTSDNAYKFIDELRASSDKAREEFVLYLGGKYAEDADANKQAELNFDGDKKEDAA